MSEFADDLSLAERVEVKKPSLYRVLMLNDHYTTMEFVVRMLMEVFGKPELEANNIMLDVHRRGFGLCGVFTKEIAESKVHKVHQAAKNEGFPLRCTIEKE